MLRPAGPAPASSPRRIAGVLALLLLPALAGSCSSPLSADGGTVVEVWQITSFNGNVAQVQIVVSNGSGVISSDGPPDWQENSWSCIDPLVIQGNASDGAGNATFDFSFDTKGNCSQLYAAQGQTLTSDVNSPSLASATQATGTLYASYQDRHTPSYSQAGNYQWSAVRIQ